ncbi:MAG: hypothetical protein IJV27_05255 [Prevotella sp.]|nr:hypothetical protein [Prevotella sp.]
MEDFLSAKKALYIKKYKDNNVSLLFFCRFLGLERNKDCGVNEKRMLQNEVRIVA